MAKNMGAVDRTVRIAVAVVIAVLYFMGVIGGVLAAILGILAAIFVLTSLVSVCPLYIPFKLSTMGKKAKGGT